VFKAVNLCYARAAGCREEISHQKQAARCVELLLLIQVTRVLNAGKEPYYKDDARSPATAADGTTVLLLLLLLLAMAQVTDFTMTRVLDAGKTHCSTTSLGTITHVAPEVLLSG
jgi:hypothetical protein